MTEAMGGFLDPERRAATERREGGSDFAGGELRLAVLRTIATEGHELSMHDVVDRVAAPIRSLTAAVNELERDGLLTVEQRGTEELLDITSAGQKALRQ